MSPNPLVLHCSGIPISAETLDFGTATQEQLNNLSSFSQLVNGVSTSSDVWSPGGTATWSIYELVLTQSDFAQGISRDTMQESFEASTHDAARAIPSRLHAAVSPRLEAIGFHFGAARSQPFCETTLPAPREIAPESTLAATFQTLYGALTADALIDTRGATFYPTYFYPNDFADAVNDGLWIPFEITPGQADPWQPVGDGETIRGEMLVLPLQRSWWSPWIFSSRGWRFQPASGLPQLSDGNSPPQGMMPFYASSLIIARNLTVSSAPKAAAPPALFTLKSEPAQSAGTTAAGMSIIGFVCTTLPRCPDPDPTLQWELALQPSTVSAR